jgi:hypothetical protein
VDPTQELAGVVDRLGALDPALLGDADTVVALHRELERLAAWTAAEFGLMRGAHAVTRPRLLGVDS